MGLFGEFTLFVNGLKIAGGVSISAGILFALKKATDTYKQRKNVTSMRELNNNAREFAVSIAQIGVQIINLIMLYQASRKSGRVNEIKPSETANKPLIHTEPVIKSKPSQAITKRITLMDNTGKERSCLSKLEAVVTKENLGGGTDTNDSSRTFARLLEKDTDDAGHVLGKLLGGKGGKDYVFPQDPHVNRGIFQRFEGDVANKVIQLDKVKVELVFSYTDPLYPTRPSIILYKVFDINGGLIFKRTFGNP